MPVSKTVIVKRVTKDLRELAELLEEEEKEKEFDQDAQDIEKLLPGSAYIGGFTKAWSNLVIICLTYNFFTVFYYLGIKGFPSGAWLIFEISIELVTFVDLILRFYF